MLPPASTLNRAKASQQRGTGIHTLQPMDKTPVPKTLSKNWIYISKSIVQLLAEPVIYKGPVIHLLAIQSLTKQTITKWISLIWVTRV